MVKKQALEKLFANLNIDYIIKIRDTYPIEHKERKKIDHQIMALRKPPSFQGTVYESNNRNFKGKGN